MKKLLCVLLSFIIVLSLCACSSSTSSVDTGTTVQKGDEAEAPTVPPSEEDVIDDSAWDELESLGKIETEGGLFFVSITMPAEFVGSDITQASIDANAGEMYTSGKLNEDGSVTYKMTKKQHKAMLDSITESIDDGLQELVNSPDYAFTEITHNEDFTSFDVHLSTEEVGFTEGFMAMGLYMYGGMYSLFTGREVDNIDVNYYSASGNLISTANSSDMNG